jgi:hypothetical protein
MLDMGALSLLSFSLVGALSTELSENIGFSGHNVDLRAVSAMILVLGRPFFAAIDDFCFVGH